MEKPDFSIFYSLEYINTHRKLASSHPEWGKIIESESRAGDFPSEFDSQLLRNVIFKPIDFTSYANKHILYDEIINKMKIDNDINQHYRNSAKYYFDCFNILNQHEGVINRIVEVGTHFGDLSCLFSGMLQKLDATLDLVDINPLHLIKTYQRIKKIFPEVAAKVRLFFGDLPLYIKQIASKSPYINLIHYQGSYNFNDVVRDLGSTFYAKQKIAGTMIYNTHLRTTDMNHYAFIDVAIYSLFGLNVKFKKMGEQASGTTEIQTSHQPPIYFADQRVEGMFLPYAVNEFRYPHQNTSLDDFFEKESVCTH